MSTLAEELAIAMRAIDDGDLPHAAAHLANAIELGPDRESVSEALDAFADAAADDALTIVAPNQDGNTPGWIALRAALLAKQERWDDATAMLLDVQAAAPSVAYASWLLDWLEDERARAAIDPERFATGAIRVLKAANEDVAEDIVLALEALYEEHPESELLFFACCVELRKRGERDVAQEMAEARVRSHPSARAYIALAGVRREAGELEAAIDLFERAAALSPEDAGALLDVGDLWIELGDLANALGAYERALAIRDDDDWALSSAAYLRVLRDGDRDASASLLARARRPGASARSIDLATRIAPFVFALPTRPESCISSLRSALERHSRMVEMAVSSLEAPSALLAIRRALRGAPLPIQVLEIPSPDPRDPIEDVPFVLWKFPSVGAFGWLTGARATEAKPAVPPPRASTIDAIVAIAARDYEPDAWWDEARRVARALGDDAIREASAAMVHPPDARPPHSEWDWIFRVQVAAALVIARSSRDWPGPRRDALRAIVAGPVDWVVSAALAAMTEIAVRERAAREAVYFDLFAALKLRPPSPIVHMCMLEPIAHLALRIPDHPAEIQRLYLDMRRKIELGRV